mmetsp:Transcript_22379/g.68728  ORF Transcript_22379/g.68728 Transcript_22379/m.68728 type:complete len:88 (-) Transcript_22379:20-283(-)
MMSTQVCLVRQDGTVVKEWVAQRRAATRHPMPPFPDKINLHLSKESYHNVGASAAGEAHAVDVKLLADCLEHLADDELFEKVAALGK